MRKGNSLANARCINCFVFPKGLQNRAGVLFMGIAALILMLVTRGSIQILIVRAKDKSSALKEMMEILLKARRISDPGTVLKTLWEHETIDTTGIGQGVAFPHASIEGLKEPCRGR